MPNVLHHLALSEPRPTPSSGDLVASILAGAAKPEDEPRASWSSGGRALGSAADGPAGEDAPPDSAAAEAAPLDRRNAKKVRVIFWSDGFTVEDVTAEEAEEAAREAAEKAAPRRTGLATLGSAAERAAARPQMPKLPPLRKYEDNQEFMDALKKGIPPLEVLSRGCIRTGRPAPRRLALLRLSRAAPTSVSAPRDRPELGDATAASRGHHVGRPQEYSLPRRGRGAAGGAAGAAGGAGQAQDDGVQRRRSGPRRREQHRHQLELQLQWHGCGGRRVGARGLRCAKGARDPCFSVSPGKTLEQRRLGLHVARRWMSRPQRPPSKSGSPVGRLRRSDCDSIRRTPCSRCSWRSSVGSRHVARAMKPPPLPPPPPLPHHPHLPRSPLAHPFGAGPAGFVPAQAAGVPSRPYVLMDGFPPKPLQAGRPLLPNARPPQSNANVQTPRGVAQASHTTLKDAGLLGAAVTLKWT